MRTIKNQKQLKSAIEARETELFITDSSLAKKVWVAYTVRKYMPKFAAVLGAGAAVSLITGPVGLAATAAVATPVVGAAALSTGVEIALIIASLSVIAMLLRYNVAIEYAGKDGTVRLRFNKA